MKTFKEYSKDGDQFFVNKDGRAVFNEPVYFRMDGKKGSSKKKLKEDYSSLPRIDTLPGQHKDSSEADKQHTKLSDEIKSHQQKPSEEHEKHLKSYTNVYSNQSHTIARKVISNHKKGLPETEGMKPKDAETHKAIAHVANQKIGKEIHLYSGTKFDPRKAVKKSKSDIVHMPAHLSTTHSIQTAHMFALGHAETEEGDVKPMHILHIHAKPSDKGYHVGGFEKETIIPGKTNLKYSHTTDHSDDHVWGPNLVHVHHFTIHSQD